MGRQVVGIRLLDEAGNPITSTNPLSISSSSGGYSISDIDDSADPAYYGFLSADGSWYILRETSSTGAYRYAKGTTDYSTNWTNRATLTYDLYDVTF